MKNLIYLALLTLIISCDKKTPSTEKIETENLTQQQIDSILVDYNFEYNNPVFIDSIEQILIPITTHFEETRSKILTKSYNSTSYPKYWNILFYNSSTGKTNLLTESKMRISDFDANLRDVGQILSKSILYKISISDFNNDEKLNYHDPEYLFISKENGTKLKQLSPSDEDLLSYSIIPNSDQLIIKTKRDSNNNLKFDNEDDLIWYKIDLKDTSKPIEIIDSDKRTKIKNLYFEQWLKK